METWKKNKSNKLQNSNLKTTDTEGCSTRKKKKVLDNEADRNLNKFAYEWSVVLINHTRKFEL